MFGAVRQAARQGARRLHTTASQAGGHGAPNYRYDYMHSPNGMYDFMGMPNRKAKMAAWCFLTPFSAIAISGVAYVFMQSKVKSK